MYCNLVLINHTDAEFVLDFAFLQPSAPQARVRARILSSPRHTKRLLRALETNVQRYEERFGRIDRGGAGARPDHRELRAVRAEVARRDAPSV